MNRIKVYHYATDVELDTDPDAKDILAGWFDLDAATRYDEDREWNGSNHISKATGSQYDHEILYRTVSGRWVLHWWSQWQGRRETYRFVTDEQARDWLLRNDHDGVVNEHFGEIEPERGPGRPEIGPMVNIRFPEMTIARLDVAAAALGIKRAEMVRRFVEQGLTALANDLLQIAGS